MHILDKYFKKWIHIFSKYCDSRCLILDLYISWYLLFIAILFLIVNVNNVQSEVIIRESDSMFASSGNARSAVSSNLFSPSVKSYYFSQTCWHFHGAEFAQLGWIPPVPWWRKMMLWEENILHEEERSTEVLNNLPKVTQETSNRGMNQREVFWKLYRTP